MKSPNVVLVIWYAPFPSWLKFNTNGIAFGSLGQTGCGGVVRNCRRFIKWCFWASFPFCSTIEVEI